MVEDHKLFDSTYNNVVSVVLAKLNKLRIARRMGRTVDFNKIKTLSAFIFYLERVKTSKYNYIHVQGLTGIVKYLNRI